MPGSLTLSGRLEPRCSPNVVQRSYLQLSLLAGGLYPDHLRRRSDVQNCLCLHHPVVTAPDSKTDGRGFESLPPCSGGRSRRAVCACQQRCPNRANIKELEVKADRDNHGNDSQPHGSRTP